MTIVVNTKEILAQHGDHIFLVKTSILNIAFSTRTFAIVATTLFPKKSQFFCNEAILFNTAVGFMFCVFSKIGIFFGENIKEEW